MLPRLHYSPVLSELIVYMSHAGFGEQFTKMIFEYVDEGLQPYMEPGEYLHSQIKSADKNQLLHILGDEIFVDMVQDEMERSPTHAKMIDHLLEYLLDNRFFMRISSMP